MKEQPLVSVVMANYNYERYIGASIQSVLDQTYPNWELIVVDDASTDGSVEKVRGFRDPRIRLLENPRNCQISFSRNRACQEAKGDYIAILDSDDIWMRDKLEKQLAYMEEHPETGACFSWIVQIDEQGQPSRDKEMERLIQARNRPRASWLHDLMLKGNCLSDPSSLIRKSTMDRIQGSRLGLVQLQDLDRWIRVLLEEEIHVIQEPLLKYRWTGAGASISSPSADRFHRLHLETAWIVGNTIREMNGTLFREAFGAEMRRPEANTPEETEIEKAFLLCSDLFGNAGIRIYGFEMMEELLREEKTAAMLRDLYGYTQLDLYRMTGEPILYDPSCRFEQERLSVRVEELESKIRLMEGSRWWRLGEKLRRAAGKGTAGSL